MIKMTKFCCSKKIRRNVFKTVSELNAYKILEMHEKNSNIKNTTDNNQTASVIIKILIHHNMIVKEQTDK